MVGKLSFIKKVFKRLTLILLVCLPASLLDVQPAIAENRHREEAKNIESSRSKARNVQQKISEKKDQISTLKRRARKLIAELDTLDRTIAQAKHRLEELISEESYIQTEMTKIESKRTLLTKELEVLEEQTAKRLIAYYKLNRLGIAPILFSAQSFTDLWQRYYALESILSYDRYIWNNFQTKQEQYNALTKSLENRQKEVQCLKARILEEQHIIGAEKTKRTELLAHVQNRKESAQAALQELIEVARQLDDIIRKLEKAAKEKAKSTTKKIPMFAAQKGHLPMPVQGSIVTSFGKYKHPTFNIYHFQNGIDFKAKEGSPIRAVHDGKVIYAGWFKGYGNIVIIDHGEGYYTLSAHASSLAQKVGDIVKKGEIVGVVGDTGSLKGPGLYFEIRHHGKPINPAKWLKRGQIKRHERG
jgi:septal ring factor EnvC (AmiA/AmiB activator)